MSWTGHGALRGRSLYRDLVAKSEGKRPLERPRHRWEDNIKINHQKVVCEGMGWIYVAQDRDGGGRL